MQAHNFQLVQTCTAFPLSWCSSGPTAPDRRGAPALPGPAAEHRREPPEEQLPLPDGQLSGLVCVRGRRQRVPLRSLQEDQLYSLQGKPTAPSPFSPPGVGG